MFVFTSYKKTPDVSIISILW